MQPEGPVLADLQQETVGLAAELREMLRLRWQLARMELESDAAALKRLGIRLAIAVAMVLTALPLLMICAAEILERSWGIPKTGTLAAFAAALVVVALALGWMAWRRFRREWVALDETLAELREDLVWLEEWTGRAERRCESS